MESRQAYVIWEGLCNIDSLDEIPTGVDNRDSFPPWRETV
jgi:hypothetical protein